MLYFLPDEAYLVSNPDSPRSVKTQRHLSADGSVKAEASAVSKYGKTNNKIVQKYEELLGIVKEKNRLRRGRFYTMGYTNNDIEDI